MQAFVKVGLIAVAMIAVTACNSGGTNLPLGNLCKADHKPISMTPVNGQKKLAMKPGDPDPGLPEGTYTYSRADLFYKENIPVDPITWHVADTALPNGTSSKQVPVCMRNARPNMTGIDNKTNAITDMVVCPNKKIIKTRLFEFGIERAQIFVRVPVVNTDTKSEPDDAYPRDPGTGSGLGKVDSTLLVQANPSTYVVNSKVLGDTGEFMVSVTMAYKKCPAGGCPECH